MDRTRDMYFLAYCLVRFDDAGWYPPELSSLTKKARRESFAVPFGRYGSNPDTKFASSVSGHENAVKAYLKGSGRDAESQKDHARWGTSSPEELWAELSRRAGLLPVRHEKVPITPSLELSKIVTAPPSGTIAPPYLGADSAYDADESFVPTDADERTHAFRSIAIRRGQTPFRNVLRARYGDACQITGTRTLDCLEAAHINPYRGEKDNNPANGLLLRADIHVLFDLDLIGIEPDSLKVLLAEQVRSDSAYADLHGRTLITTNGNGPSKETLERRYKLFQARCKASAAA